uniref:Uncharacterized protein n=1 Tax=Plectus sambesii TaxID=2011161 RepID=A0A914VI17_9BILA
MRWAVGNGRMGSWRWHVRVTHRFGVCDAATRIEAYGQLRAGFVPCVGAQQKQPLLRPALLAVKMLLSNLCLPLPLSLSLSLSGSRLALAASVPALSGLSALFAVTLVISSPFTAA